MPMSKELWLALTPIGLAWHGPSSPGPASFKPPSGGPLGVALAVIVLVAATLTVGCAKPTALGDPLNGLTKAEREQFQRGLEVFNREFTPETGLGPLFNANACGECHEEPVAGGPGDEVEVHVALVRPDKTCDDLAASGGPVIQQEVTPALKQVLGIDAESAPVGAPLAKRTTPDVFGFGLLDAVPEKRILSYADPDDRNGDGISGRPNLTAGGRVGRFGRKAQEPSLRTFNAGAFLIEQGVTHPGDLKESTVGGQPLPEGVDPAAEPELDAQAVEDTDTYVRLLAPPAPLSLDRKGERGQGVFERIGCAACHLPVLKTGRSPVDALDHKKVHAYTDLLLHDMGPDLADICLGSASPSEFRTEPLMGLRLSSQFLHDGRAKTIEEAIVMHGGEAARSRDRFRSLNDKDRAALLAFLGSL